MEQVKMFDTEGFDIEFVEKAINKWLRKNGDNIIIMRATQSQDADHRLFITIWYRAK